MPVVLPLQKMSRDEKLRAMEALWADLSQDEDRFESPVWHAQALREADRIRVQEQAWRDRLDREIRIAELQQA